MKAPVALLAVLAVIPLFAACTGGSGAGPSPAALADLDKQLAALESSVRTIADDRAILANELRYTRGLDRHDEKLIDAAYWPDAIVTYGRVIKLDELGPWANDLHAGRAAHQHHVTAINLDIDGSTAHEEGYILFSADTQRDTSFDTQGTPSPGRVLKGTKATLGSGRYMNRYERRDGEWKMVVHEYVNDLSIRFDPVDLCATACLGRWDATDISYLRPLQSLTEEERGQRSERGRKPTAAKR